MNLDLATPLEAVLDTVDTEIARLQGVKAGIEDALNCVEAADLYGEGPLAQSMHENVQVANNAAENVAGVEAAKGEGQSIGVQVDEQVLQDMSAGLIEVVTDTPDEPPAPPRPDEVPNFLKNPPKPKVVKAKKKFDNFKRGKWSDDEIDLLKRRNEEGVNGKVIAAELGRPYTAMAAMKKVLGLKTGQPAPASAAPSATDTSKPQKTETKAVVQTSDHRQTIIRPGPRDSTWSVFDDLELVRMFASGSGKSDIAIVLERTQQECVDRFNGLIGSSRVLGAQEQLMKDLRILCDRAEQAEGIAAQ